jgi:hypothetical protein
LCLLRESDSDEDGPERRGPGPHPDRPSDRDEVTRNSRSARPRITAHDTPSGSKLKHRKRTDLDRSGGAGGLREGAFVNYGALYAANQEFRGVGEGGLVDPAGEHARHLLEALLALDAGDTGDRAPPGLLLRHDDVGGGL